MLQRLMGTASKNGSLDSVYILIECRRTMEAMQLNAPRLKIPTKAAFSRFGRWTLRSVVIGRTRIQMSIAMLTELVAVCYSVKLTTYRGGCLTVEQRRGVDAFSLHKSGKIPHLVQWYALRETTYYAYAAKGCEKVYGAFAEDL
tara:strand:+ start:3139 stop:3570 length:432 start_codon:yes stop_codon:yes gene_type:complete